MFRKTRVRHSSAGSLASIGLCCLGLFGLSAAQAGSPLLMGVFPYLDASALAQLHRPLQQHLAESTATPVRMVSAPDFSTFIERTGTARYDILATAPHLGRRAEKEAGYQWLGLTQKPIHAVFLTTEGNGISNIRDLEGKTLALPPESAIVHHLARSELKRHGLVPGRDIRLKAVLSHNNALKLLLLGLADAAAIADTVEEGQAAKNKNSWLRIGQTEGVPGVALMVHPRVPVETRATLRRALFAFSSSAQGKRYFDRTQLHGVRKPEPADMLRLDEYLAAMAAAPRAD